ncbi:hypothetical protein M8R20_11560 [Pseudomonas sp. R2.Fl]|nr:hypothetical protein [Pseudomonas sp. R2.Fl]
MLILRTPRSSLAWTGLFAAWLAIAPAAAQEEETPPSRPPGEDCQVEPDRPGAETTPGDEEFSGKLDDCNGVLEPPPVGDPDLVEPAPPVGRTPVIPPEQVPEQENENSL